MITIRGSRDSRGNARIIKSDGSDKSLLDERLDWANHSPGGMEWGYYGSGPTQLAIAMLGAVADRTVALNHYYEFKTEVVARFPRSGWQMSVEEIRRWLNQKIELGEGLPDASPQLRIIPIKNVTPQ